jgi:hypothetical protein
MPTIGRYYLHPEDGEVLITSGSYMGAFDRVSNFWSYVVVATGEEGGDYANRPWPAVDRPSVFVQVTG